MTENCVGVIGGSGVYQIEALQNVEEVTVTTPFGAVGSLHGGHAGWATRRLSGTPRSRPSY
ncbi:MAG: hypothetical protein R2932_12025 [Caldilineaceae bacterium]